MATVSIYAFVRQKLVWHGASKAPDGAVIFENKKIFLEFVKLERAIRRTDFEGVQSSVKTIENLASALGKRHLVAFAYLYTYFSQATPKVTRRDVKLDNGRILKSLEYERDVSPEERLIADWARLWSDKNGMTFLRIAYKPKA